MPSLLGDPARQSAPLIGRDAELGGLNQALDAIGHGAGRVVVVLGEAGIGKTSLLEAIASSLTELFSPQIIGERLTGMLKGYDFVSADTLAYFSARPPLAQRDSDFALDYVKRHAETPDAQQAVLKALEFKCDVLWAMLDALYHAYVAPRHVPPGAFVPQDWSTA